MSGHQTATLADTVYFWFAANDTSGSGGDGATPLYDVREAGAAASAIPLLSGTPSLLTHANYPAGCHEIAVAATAGNGFAADDTFAVFCTLAVDSQNPSGFVGSCTLTPLAKTAALATAQTDLDTLTGSDGATLATAQALYAPAKAGDNMGTCSDVSNLSNLPTIPANWLTAAGTAADFGTEIGTACWATAARTLTASTNFNDIAAGDVWAVDATGQQTQGTFGQAIGDPVADTTTIYQAVATDAAGDNVSIDVVAVKAETALIVADTNELQVDDVPTTLATLATTTELNKVPKSDGTTSWNATALGAINAEVDTALVTTTYAEPGQGTPAATASLKDKIGYLYKAWRNKSLQNATTYELYNDDAATVDQKATCSDDATDAIKGEVATGP